MLIRISLFIVLAALASVQSAIADNCLVVAHRGASAYLPEHTLEAYSLAVAQGADYIEPDVVLTKDGVPVVRHEALLDLTTDVASREEFAHLRSSRELYGQTVEGWFVDDFTLEQIKSLRARERWPEIRQASAAHDGEFEIPTLAEVIALTRRARWDVGLYIEFKSSSYFSERGQDNVAAVVNALSSAGLNRKEAKVLLQSFEPEDLRRAKTLSPHPRIQLLYTDKDLNLAEIARYAQGIGVPKYDFPLDFAAADDAGLVVHVYTFRAEERFLPERHKGELAAEITEFLERGMDGFFTDHPDIGRAVCDARSKSS